MKNFQKLFAVTASLDRIFSDSPIDVDYAQYLVNKETGDLLSWDPLSSELFKIKGNQTTLRGKIEAGEITKFIHLTSASRLFI